MKKNNLIVICSILLLIILGVVLYFGCQYVRKIQIDKENERIIKEIADSYSEFVEIKKDKKLYKKEEDTYKEIGTIYKNTKVSLQKKKIIDKNDIYYKIKDSDYYIDYYDLGKTDDKWLDYSLNDYISTKVIKTNPTILKQKGVTKIEIKEPLEFDALLIDNNKYYVTYLNTIYYIEDSYEVLEKEEKEVLNDISVLNFSDDISDQKFDEVLKYLNENNYHSITIEDFIRFMKGQIDLPINQVLLLSYKELSDTKKEIVSKYLLSVCTDFSNVTFKSGDTKLKKKDETYYKYDINSNTSIDRVKDMLAGIKEPIIIPEQQIAVLNYHFFYDATSEACNESICMDIGNFRKQLDYLKNNGYRTLTMQEFNDWMDRKISLPQKSVLITVDDGALGTSKINGNKLIPILEEYQMHATLFLISAWWDVANYQSDYLEVYSHGDDLHADNYCRNNQCGYKGLLLTKEELINDLNIATTKLGTSLAFCYPFYAKNNVMVEALKEAGYKLAFVGGNRKATQSNNKYSIPRYVMYKNTSLNSFIRMIQ